MLWCSVFRNVSLFRSISFAIIGFIFIFMHAINLSYAKNNLHEIPYFTEYVSYGSQDAPVHIAEFFSFSCPHCANFYATTFQKIKSKYIDTGKVLWTSYEVYFDRQGLHAAIVARCGGEDAYTAVKELLLIKQREWLYANDYMSELKKYGKIIGMPHNTVGSCVKNNSFAKELVNLSKQALIEYNITSTPTFYIDGDKIEGYRDFEEFSKIIDRLLMKK